jgi:hypothetical protein
MKGRIKYVISFIPIILVAILVVAIGDIAFTKISSVYSKIDYCCLGEVILLWISLTITTICYVVISIFFVFLAALMTEDMRRKS